MFVLAVRNLNAIYLGSRETLPPPKYKGIGESCAMLPREVNHFNERLNMKKIDVDADLKRTKFLIKAMVIQVVLIWVIMFFYLMYIKS